MTRGLALKQRLREGRPVYALIHGLGSPTVAEMAALAGYHAIVVDDEHGAGDRFQHLAIAQAIRAGGSACLLRLGTHDPQAIGQALDLGVDGLLLSGVRDAEQARAIVRACRYPPHGVRGSGVGVARASGYGLFAQAYAAQCDEALFLCAIVESARGIEQVGAIAAVDGIDAIVVGVHDLAGDLGRPGDPAHADVQAALAHAEAAVLGAGKTIGTVVHAGADAAQLLARGHRFLTLGADTRLLGQAMRQQLASCPPDA